MTYVDKPNWQKSLEHHEELCKEQYRGIRREMQLMREDIREIRVSLRWLVGIVLAWPPVLIAALQLIG